jgi:hypothetical protein
LKNKGYLARGGQIINATIVSAPKQHNSREDNETIKEGEMPEDWKSKPAKDRQKDKDARWTRSINARISVTRTISAWRLQAASMRGQGLNDLRAANSNAGHPAIRGYYSRCPII